MRGIETLAGHRGTVRLWIVLLAFLLLAVPLLSASPALAQSVNLSPSSGPPGTGVTVSGSGFSDGDTYQITFAPGTVYEQLLAPTTVISGTIFSRFVSIPSAPYGQHAIVVASNRGNFSRLFQVTPQVQLIGTAGFVGDTVSADGRGFRANTPVNIIFNGNVVATTGSNTYGNLDAVDFAVPSLPQANYSVYATDGLGTSPTVIFTIRPHLVISPQEGPVGSQVQLNGTGFGPNLGVTVYWDNQIMTSNIITGSTGAFSATLVVPNDTRGSHQISARDAGQGTSSASFLVNPSITISPASGPPGTIVLLTGRGFRPNGSVRITFNAVAIATQPASFTTGMTGSFSASFVIPTIVSGNYAVSASDGLYSATVTFGVAASLVISPSSGNVGSEVVVSGTGFTPGGRVALSYDNQTVLTVTADSAGAFAVSFNAPVSMAGQHTVSARDLTSQSVMASTAFTMESTPPPVPTLLAPQYDTLTDTQPEFDWSAVADPSGVTYDLQVARDAGFSQLVLFKEGIAQAQYRVAPAEQLQLTKRTAPYYWRVRAVDAAGNTSDWTGAALFYTLDSNPPDVPVLYGPANESEASLQPAFTWSAVTDPSGVAYELQVAKDVTFVQVVISKTGLTEPQYQVTQAEQLEPTKRANPYFWRVRAVDGAGNASDWKSGMFYTEDSTPPPAPSALGPENGSETSADVSFDWTDVSDPSGVTYTLEVAQESEFIHLVVYKEGLETSQYRLTKAEELAETAGTPASPYYWRVRAVDSVQNVSNWSNINAFYVSGFRLQGWWLFAVIAIGVLLVLAAGVYLGMKIRPARGPEESA